MTTGGGWKGLDQDVFQTLVLKVDFEAGDGAGPAEAFTIPVISRTGGMMLALPKGFVPPDLLEAGGFAGEADFVGPSHLLKVPVVLEEEDGSHVSLDFDIEVMLVDFHGSVAENLRGFDPVTEGPGIAGFCEDLPRAKLLAVQFYSADEAQQLSGEGAPSTPVIPKQSKQKATTPAKRVTTAVLAEQLAGLASSLPALSTQLAQMEKRQEKVESLLAAPAQALVATQAVPQPFSSQAPNASRFLRHVGSPPRLKTPAQGAVAQADAQPVALPSHPDYQPRMGQVSQGTDAYSMSELLLQQSQALTMLVSQIASNDGLHDLGGATSSTSLSLRGSTKREKLICELAGRKGDFFLKIAQNAFRRMKPSDPVPMSLADFQGRTLFTKYVEKSGGFQGQRDFGLVMWLLAHIAAADYKGAQELLALTLVTIEQAAQDGGKWDVAWLLSLQEDPPPGVFQARPAATNPRLRAFAPLCPPEWATVALAYVKEVASSTPVVRKAWSPRR